MSVTVVSCGVSNSSTVGATITLSSATALANIPAGAVIAVSVFEESNSAPAGSISDSGGNTYSAITGINVNNSAANGFLRIFYSFSGNAVALMTTGSIVYTKAVSGSSASVSVLYVTGLVSGDPLDSSVTNTAAGGSGASITVTSNTASSSGDLLLAAAATNSNSITYNQDTTHNWATPFDSAAFGGNCQGGGNQVISGVAGVVFAPTFSSNVPWAVAVVGLKTPFVPSPAPFPSVPHQRLSIIGY